MKKDWFDEYIKDRIPDEPALPGVISSRIDKTLASLPERKIKNFRLHYILAAAAAVLFLTAGSVFALNNPVINEKISQVPLFQSVFGLVNDSDLKYIDEKGLADNVNESTVDKGINVTITNVYYDGVHIILGYTIESGDKNITYHIDESPAFFGEKLRNCSVRFAGYGLLNNVKSLGVLQITPDRPLAEKFQLKIAITKLYKLDLDKKKDAHIDGKWNFDIQVNQNNEQSYLKEFDPPLIFNFRNVNIRIGKTQITPTGTEIEMQISGTAKNVEAFNKWVYLTAADDKGKKIGFKSKYSNVVNTKDKNNETRNIKLFLSHVDANAPFITLYASIYNFDYSNPKNKVDLTDKLPVRIPQGKAGDLLITRIDYRSDAAYVYYDAKGSDPVEQSKLLWFEDPAYPFSEIHGMLQPAQRVAGTTNSYMQKFMHLNRHRVLKIVTNQIVSSKVMDEVSIKIPLQ